MITRAQYLHKHHQQLEDAFAESGCKDFLYFVEECWWSYDESQIDDFVTIKKEAVILSKKLDIVIEEAKDD